MGSRNLFVSYDTGMEMSTVHNGFFEVLLGVGLFGGIPWITAVLIYMAKSMKLSFRSKDELLVLFSLWPPLLVNTVMSVGLGGRGGPYVLIMGLTLSLAVRGARSPQRRSLGLPRDLVAMRLH